MIYIIDNIKEKAFKTAIFLNVFNYLINMDLLNFYNTLKYLKNRLYES